MDLPGLPIRARVSPDGKLAASTVFVTGENYASENFTTRTTLYDLATRQAIADLETFTVERDGKPFSNIDFNYWGVTFRRDSNRFLATLGTGGKRFLVEGDVARRRFQVIANDVECPSLSPDERHVVFKRKREQTFGWQLWAMNLETRESWPITDDQQDIDDQVEWLDDGRVIYGMVLGPGSPEENLGIWMSRIDRAAGKNREFFIRSGWSPAAGR
jgi:Tol biopolymer transport system component